MECEGRSDIGVRFDVSTSSIHRRLNERRGEAGKVLEPVERPGAGATCERGSLSGFVSILRQAQGTASSTNSGVRKVPELAGPRDRSLSLSKGAGTGARSS